MKAKQNHPSPGMLIICGHYGVDDENDSDDDNDGIPDVFEVKYSGSHAGPWKPADDSRATLCPRIKVNLVCGKYTRYHYR